MLLMRQATGERMTRLRIAAGPHRLVTDMRCAQAGAGILYFLPAGLAAVDKGGRKLPPKRAALGIGGGNVMAPSPDPS